MLRLVLFLFFPLFSLLFSPYDLQGSHAKEETTFYSTGICFQGGNIPNVAIQCVAQAWLFGQTVSPTTMYLHQCPLTLDRSFRTIRHQRPSFGSSSVDMPFQLPPMNNNDFTVCITQSLLLGSGMASFLGSHPHHFGDHQKVMPLLFSSYSYPGFFLPSMSSLKDKNLIGASTESSLVCALTMLSQVNSACPNLYIQHISLAPLLLNLLPPQ